MTNEQVKHVFAHRQAGSSNNLHSDGTVLKSYSTPIAVWIEDVCFISSNGMSPTTAGKHLSGLASALRGSRYFYTPAFSYRARQAPSAAACLIEAAEEMQEIFKKILRKRSYVAESVEQYENRRQEILSMAGRFSVQDLPAMPEASGDLKAKAKEQAEKERRQRAEQQRREEEQQRAQRIIDQGELDLWLQQGRGRYPASFRKRGEDQITIKQGYIQETLSRADGNVNTPRWVRDYQADTVITSQGAEAPLAHVVKALAFYAGRERRACPACNTLTRMTYNECACGESLTDVPPAFVPYRTNGHKVPLGNFTLDSIDEQGNVTAGCHRFTAAEIARFRKQWDL